MFTIDFRKPGWTEQIKAVSECIFKYSFLYADRRTVGVNFPDFSTGAIREFNVKVLDTF